MSDISAYSRRGEIRFEADDRKQQSRMEQVPRSSHCTEAAQAAWIEACYESFHTGLLFHRYHRPSPQTDYGFIRRILHPRGDHSVADRIGRVAPFVFLTSPSSINFHFWGSGGQASQAEWIWSIACLRAGRLELDDHDKSIADTEDRRWNGLASWMQIARQLLSIISVSVLARRIPPAAYGLVGMAVLVTNLLETIRDVGTGLH